MAFFKPTPGCDRPTQAAAESAFDLVPPAVLVPLWMISLVLPNLVYSGIFWYDTLHIVKWAVAGVPVGIAALLAGMRLLLYGRGRIRFQIDAFGILWLVLLAYAASQALWVPISSKGSFIHELLCFGAVWAFYVISWNSFPNRSIRPLLWLANINAVINVLFAELQIRNLNGITSLILPTPGNYIGNTGQQNMFGLWMAVCIMSSVYLYIAYAVTPSGKKRHPAVTLLNLLIMGINIWGLWNSTSRSAIFSLFAALIVLAFVTLRQFGRDYAKRLLHVLLLFILVLGAAMFVNKDRAGALITKTIDMIQNAETYGGRDGIWATSRSMVKMYPWTGVGIGQYKWHYLEAQREMFKAYPDKSWQYTHWAHNEFLQWFAEGGAVGGALLIALWGMWGLAFLTMLWRKEHVALEVIWGCALVTLVTFNAQWTRPFHRVENILWLALAFAVSNRDRVRVLTPRRSFFPGWGARACGLLLAAVSLSGLLYLGDGMVGDRTIRKALSAQMPVVRRNLLEKASTHLMVRNDALKNLAYHDMQIGQENRDVRMLGQGYQLLWQHFLREPHSEELRFLLDWTLRFQDVEKLKLLTSYMKPGTVRLENVVDEAGNVVSMAIPVSPEEPASENTGTASQEGPLAP